MIKPYQYENTKVETKPTPAMSSGGIKPFNYTDSPSGQATTPTAPKVTEPVSISAWKPGQRQETISAYDPSKYETRKTLGEKLSDLSDKIFRKNESATARTIRKQQDSFEELVNNPAPDEINGKSPFKSIQSARDLRKSKVPTAKGILEGISDVSKSDTPFAGAIIDATEIGQIYLTAQKMKKGEEIPPEDYKKLLDFYTKESALSAKRESDAGYRVGEGMRNSLTFMAELLGVGLLAPETGGGSIAGMVAEKGVYKAAREIATKMMADTALKELLQKELKVYGVQLAKRGAVIAGSQELVHLPENTLQKMVGTPQFTVGNGKIDVSFADDGQSLPEATMNAFTGILVETGSEFTGGIFSAIPKAARNGLVKAGILKAVIAKNPNLPAGAIEKIISTMGWNGVIEEMGEEQIGNIAYGVLNKMGLSDTEFHVPTMQEIGEQFLSFSLMGTVISGVSRGYGAIVAKKVQEGTPNDIKDMTDTLGDYVDNATKSKTPAEIIKDLETIGIKTDVAGKIVENAMKTEQQNAPAVAPLDLTKIGLDALTETKNTTESPKVSEISPDVLEQSINDIFAGKTAEEVAKQEMPVDTKNEKIQTLKVKKVSEASGDVPTFEQPELNEDFDNNPVVFKKGSFVVDRDGTVHEVISGNDKYKKSEPLYDMNIGYLRTRQLGQKADYLNYANQVRPATTEEIAQAQEYEKKNPPKNKKEEPVVKKTSKRKAKTDTKSDVNVGDSFDTKGGTNMKSPITVTSIEGRTVKFKDADGVYYSGMEKSAVKNMLNEGAWAKVETSTVDNLLTSDISVGDTFKSDFGRVFTIGKIEDGTATEVGHESDIGYDVDLDQLATWDKIETPKQAKKITTPRIEKALSRETDALVEKTKELNKKLAEREGIPTFEVGDRVSFVNNKGETLTGSVQSTDNDSSMIDVDQIVVVAGGLPIGRLERVSNRRLEKLEKPLSKRDQMLLDYRKETLPELNLDPALQTLDVFVDSIRELDPKKEADKFYIEKGAKYEVKTSYPASLGEMGNYDVSHYDEYPTVEDITENVVFEIYNDFLKDVGNSAREENIEKAIKKALADFKDSGILKTYGNQQGGVPNTSDLSKGEDSTSGGGATNKISGYDRATMLVELGNGSGSNRTAELTKKQRQLINEEVESLLETRNFSTNTEDYSEEDRLLMSAYTGSGGKESVGASGAGLLNEYYTPPKLINKVWEIAKKLLPNAQTAFEPSVGVGRFIELSPVEVQVDGAEISKTSGTIASVLYPDSNITIGDFQELFFDKKTNKQKQVKQYDLVVGNPPFGDRAGFLKGKGEESDISREEEYFIKRGLDMVKEGGYLIYVVNSSFLKKGVTAGKNAISQLGQLEVAYRLPEDSFEDTTIGTDIVVFKKTPATDAISVMSRNQTLRDDMYFRSVLGGNNVLGETLVRKNRFGQQETYVKGDLNTAIDKINPDFLQTGEVVEDKETIIEQGETVAEEQIAALEEDKKKTKTKVSTPKKGVVYTQTTFPTKGAEKLITPKQNISNKTNYSPIEVNMLKKIDRDMAIQDPTSVELPFLNYAGVEYFNDGIYFSGEIYKKLTQLENDKAKIVAQFGQEQFDKQKAGLEAVIPKKVTIKEVAFDPLDRHITDIPTTLVSRNGREEKGNVLSAFTQYLRSNDVALSPRVSKWDVITFVQGQNLSKGTKPIEGYIKSDAKRLFNQFLKNELAPETQKAIEEKYNTEKNGYVQPDYTKIPVEIENMAKQFRGRDFLLSETQKNGIGFLVNKGSGLIAYGVGVGKTHTLAIATVANMQKGWSNRPLYVVPKSTIDKTWLATLHQMFPTLVINNLEGLQAPIVRRLIKEKGENKTEWIKDGELTIISHEGILRLGLNEDELRTATGDLKDALWVEPKTKRGGEKTKNVYDEIAGNAQKYVTDIMISDLGFDHISVDEVHNFRKVFQGAKAEKVDEDGNAYGKKRYANILGGTPSRRAQQLFLISQYIQKNNNNRNVFLASATPFENHATEVYNILSFVARDRMRAMGILNINDFFASFANFEVELDQSLTGEPITREKMNSFVNLPTLQTLLKEFIDRQEDPTLVRPERRVITPHLQMSELQIKNRERIQNLLTGIKDQIDDTEGFDEESKAFFDVAMSTKEVDDGAFLKASTYSIANSVSPYFIKEYVRKVPTAEQLVEDSPKIKYAIETLKTVKADPKTADFGTFLFFGKMGVEYHPMIAKYIAKEVGYKEDEVAVLSGDVTDDQKEDIKERFNDGRVKVLLGGDQTKEGIDLQNNGFITINLALGWNPTQISQVEGRVWRQGNRRSIAPLVYPLVENSGDATIFSKFKEKSGRINDLFSYSGKVFDVGEVDPAEKKLSLITDPKFKAKMQIEIDKTTYYNERLLLENDIKELKAMNADKNQMTGDLTEFEQNLENGVDRWGDPMDEDAKKEIKKEIKSLKGKIERIDARIEAKNIIDINAEIGELEGKIIDMDAKIKSIDKTYDEKLAFFSEQYKKDIKNRKTMSQHMDQIKSLIAELKERTPEEIDNIRAKKIADEEARKRSSVPEFQKIEKDQNITLKTLDRLGDRKTVSKQFIADLTRKADIKKVEKDLLEQALASESGTIVVEDFKKKVMLEVLPLQRNSSNDFRVTIKEVEKKIEDKGYRVDEDLDGSVFLLDKNEEYAEYDELPDDVRELLDTYSELAEEGQGKPKQVGFERFSLPNDLRGEVANYSENIYESPVKTSAGDVHFPARKAEGYFGHTRVEDMIDGETRRVIEVQSDLYQKGNLDKELGIENSISGEKMSMEKVKELYPKKYAEIQSKQKLAQYNDPTAHFRMVREEVKKASQDGKTKLQFPTGETAMKIERLGENNIWSTADREMDLRPEMLKVGREINQGQNSKWIITDVLGEGKFKAVQKKDIGQKGPSFAPYPEIEINGVKTTYNDEAQETFDISGKVDTNNPIYKFYEQELAKYLRNKYNAKLVTDAQGVTWNQIDLTRELAQSPVEAFQKETSIDETLISFEEAKARVQGYKDRLKLDFDVDFVHEIFTGGANSERAYAVTYNNKLSFIENVRKTTADHEVVHMVMNNIEKISAFDGITRDQLLKAMNGGKDYTVDDLERLNEEIAINFEKKVQGVEQSSVPMVLRRFFERLEILLTKMLKALGKDVDVIQDFYRRLISAKGKETVKFDSRKELDRDVQFKEGDRQFLAFNEARAEYLHTTRVNFQKIVEEAINHSVNLRRKDISFFDSLFAQSRDLFLKDKVEFKQADELMKIGDERRMKKSMLDKKFATMLNPYFKLENGSKTKVNETLVQGDIEAREYSDYQLKEKGLSQTEIDGYKAVRKAFNVAHDLLLQEMELNGVPAEEIEQFRADRVGYLPHKWKYRFAIKKQNIKTGANPKDSDSWRTESMDVYKTAREADKAFAELNKNNKTPEEVRYVNDTLDSLDVDFFSEQRFSFENMKSIISKAKVDGDLKSEMLLGLRNMVKEKGFGRNFIKRTGIEGYEKKEIPDIIANYFAGLDGFITKMEAGKKYYGVLEKIDARRQKKFYEWTRNSIAYDMGHSKEGNAFKEFAYIFFLANDISFLVTNMTQNFTVGIGEISKLFSGSGKIVGAETSLLKAMADWSLGRVTPEEKAVITGLVDLGRLGGEMTAELMGFKNNPVYAGVSSVLNKALYNSTALVEKNVNRIPAFLAARRVLKSKGLSDKDANEQALSVSDDIHFRYGKQHRPEFMRGRKSVLFVFNHYMRSFLYQLSRDLKNREFTAVAKKLFYTVLLGGTTALPFAKLLKEIYKWIFGPDPDEEETATLGSLDLALERGIPASYLNLDLSNKVGIDIMALTNVVDELNTPKTIKEKVGNVLTSLLGAVGSLMVERIPKGVDLISQGRYVDAGAKLLPDMFGNPLKAYSGATKGVLSQSGNPLMDENGDRFRYTNYEAFLKATGYTPTREQLAWDEQSKQWDLKNKQSEGNSEVKNKIAKLIRDGKVEEARKYQEEARISGELSSSFDYVKDNLKDESYRDAVTKWESGPQTRIQLDKTEVEIAKKLYGPKYTAANLTSVTEEFAFRRTFGYDDKNANDLKKATSNKDKVLVLKRIREELGPEDFRIWFNKGRKVVQYESGRSGYVLISDPLKDLYVSSK